MRCVFLLFVVLAACGGGSRIVSGGGSASSVISVGGRTVTVTGTSHSTSVKDGVMTVTGAGHEVRVQGDWIDVDGDRRPLPPGPTVAIDLAPERVIVSVDGKAMAFTR